MLSDKVRNDRLLVLRRAEDASAKTKDALKALKHFGFDKLLIVDQRGNSDLMLSTRNIPHVKAIDVGEMNIIRLAALDGIMLSVDAVKKLVEVLE